VDPYIYFSTLTYFIILWILTDLFFYTHVL